MKTMCPPGYHHNGFVATHALGHMMYGYIYIYIYVYAYIYMILYCYIYGEISKWRNARWNIILDMTH